MKIFNNIAIMAFVLSFVAVPNTYAQTSNDTPEDRAEIIRMQIENRKMVSPETRPVEKRIEIKRENRLEIKENRADIKEARVDMRASQVNLKDTRADARAEIKDIRTDSRVEFRNIKNSSSTPTFKKEARVEIKKKMEAQQFEIRKNTLVRELNRSLENLSDIAVRIETRIEKIENGGRDMNIAKKELELARQKIETARLDVSALSSLNPTEIRLDTTVEIDLAKPRQLGDTAIKSTKDARDALRAAINSISQDMRRSETRPTPSPTTSVSATVETNI